jgi:hypothetical protein
LRKFSKSWEKSTLKGYGIAAAAENQSDIEEEIVFHANKARANYF